MYFTTLVYKIHHTKDTFQLMLMKNNTHCYKVLWMVSFVLLACSNIMYMSLKKHISKKNNTFTKMQCTGFEMDLVKFLHSDLFYSMTQSMEMKHVISLFIYTKNYANLKPNNVKLHMGKTPVNN